MGEEKPYQQENIDSLLKKYPRILIRKVKIVYDPIMDVHPYYKGVAASTLFLAEGITIRISSIGIGNSEDDLALTILHEKYHILHPEDQERGKEERAEQYARMQWESMKKRQ